MATFFTHNCERAPVTHGEARAALQGVFACPGSDDANPTSRQLTLPSNLRSRLHPIRVTPEPPADAGETTDPTKPKRRRGSRGGRGRKKTSSTGASSTAAAEDTPRGEVALERTQDRAQVEQQQDALAAPGAPAQPGRQPPPGGPPPRSAPEGEARAPRLRRRRRAARRRARGRERERAFSESNRASYKGTILCLSSVTCFRNFTGISMPDMALRMRFKHAVEV